MLTKLAREQASDQDGFEMDESIRKSTIMMKRLRSKSDSKKSGKAIPTTHCRPNNQTIPQDHIIDVGSISYVILESEYRTEQDDHDQAPACKKQFQEIWVSSNIIISIVYKSYYGSHFLTMSSNGRKKSAQDTRDKLEISQQQLHIQEVSSIISRSL
jgi:hypothetical protein